MLEAVFTYIGNSDFLSRADGVFCLEIGLPLGESDNDVGHARVIGHGECRVQEDAGLASVDVGPVEGVGL